MSIVLLDFALAPDFSEDNDLDAWIEALEISTSLQRCLCACDCWNEVFSIEVFDSENEIDGIVTHETRCFHCFTGHRVAVDQYEESLRLKAFATELPPGRKD